MKIAFCTIGSRGDIQPFLELGEYFKQQGHEVKVCSASMYLSIAENYDVNYIAFQGDYASIVDNEALKREIGKNPFTIGKALKEKVYPIIENSLETFYELTEWSDVVIYHPKTLIDSISFEMKHKLIKAYVVPAFTPTTEFVNPLIGSLPIPRFLNKLTYRLTNAMISVIKSPIKSFKKKHNLTQSNAFLKTPVIYGISPSLLSQPMDYPKNHIFTGFWMKNKGVQPMPKKILDFTNDDKQVLIITFGSMPYVSEININEFTKAILQQFDIKIVVVKAWGLKDVNILDNKNVLVLDSAPFDSLFPLVDFVIHHGGAGTTSAAIKAGIPQMICPVLHPFGDQYFWGKQLEKKGIGVLPIPLKKLSIRNLLESITILKSDELKINAKKIKVQTENENGLENSLKFVEDYFKSI